MNIDFLVPKLCLGTPVRETLFRSDKLGALKRNGVSRGRAQTEVWDTQETRNRESFRGANAMSDPSMMGFDRQGLDDVFAAKEVHKSNLILEGQMLERNSKWTRLLGRSLKRPIKRNSWAVSARCWV